MTNNYEFLVQYGVFTYLSMGNIYCFLLYRLNSVQIIYYSVVHVYVRKHSSLAAFSFSDCSMASTIVQVFLKQVLESYFNSQLPVRIAAVNVLHLILKQGLVHPVQVNNFIMICCLAGVDPKSVRQPGIEPGSIAWKATMLTFTPPRWL